MPLVLITQVFALQAAVFLRLKAEHQETRIHLKVPKHKNKASLTGLILYPWKECQDTMQVLLQCANARV